MLEQKKYNSIAMKNILYLFLIFPIISCSKEPEASVSDHAAYCISAGIEWIDCMTFYYRGEKYTSKYGYDPYPSNRSGLIFEDEETNAVYQRVMSLPESGIWIDTINGTMTLIEEPFRDQYPI